MACGLGYAGQSHTAPGPAAPPVPRPPVGFHPPSHVPADCVNNPDADHDSVRAVECGGTDCDDHDANRRPGNPEVCDTAGHDEDCDPTTFGIRDVDGDGFPDSLCRNVDPVTHAVLSQGTDCDDHRPFVRPGSQICVNDSTVSVCRGPGTLELKCPAPTPYCAHQPNDVGVCVPAPR